ncbi:MeR-like helix-turn-helix DNA binding domain protein [Gordonia phage Amore2]|uniref:DNA binding protein n=2 Tax=Getseptimavirus TaxID=2560139 RepID=G8FS41_9CAUD|nr:DNA binding protein [Gordonia phage GTE7]YP_009189186.1 DNA binding protein [Gordonia phage GMA7]QSL99699.1 helix-turn-helix DNA binding protein [Gordonia phage Austin]USH44875.1 MeR-like helix-turn-helix DNA binding domain protein [Gordonia phage Amore2]AER26591.1 DNA binding protein [Gordonia phage GTE7]AKJ72486.1 putative DNA binding protein [Gordonia phage GMA7]
MRIAPDQELLNTREVSEILMVTEATVRVKLREGVFPNASRPGKSWLIPRSDVHKYIKESNS